MKKIKQIPKLVTTENYEISWHNPIVANTISDAYNKVKSILADLEKLVKWEREGKINAECGDSSPSFQSIEVLDKSIEPELQKISIVSCYEVEDEDSDQSEDAND